MKTVIVKLRSVSPYSQSRHYVVPKLERELPKDYEERTWRNRMHTTNDGNVIIPPMALKNAVAEAAKYLGIQIPGKGMSNYTKHFEAGVLVLDPIVLPNKSEAVRGEWMFVPADGKRGGGKRVMKCFPEIPQWEGEAKFFVLDEIITEDVFRMVIEGAGSFIGIGRFRPRNNGYYGRFSVENIDWDV